MSLFNAKSRLLIRKSRIPARRGGSGPEVGLNLPSEVGLEGPRCSFPTRFLPSRHQSERVCKPPLWSPRFPEGRCELTQIADAGACDTRRVLLSGVNFLSLDSYEFFDFVLQAHCVN